MIMPSREKQSGVVWWFRNFSCRVEYKPGLHILNKTHNQSKCKLSEMCLQFSISSCLFFFPQIISYSFFLLLKGPHMEMKLYYRPNLSNMSSYPDINLSISSGRKQKQRIFSLCVGQNIKKKQPQQQQRNTIPFFFPLKDEIVSDFWRFLNSSTTQNW